jgi:hypothetical protein
MFVHTGDYMEHIGDDALRSTYYTFTPRPLAEGDFYVMDDALAATLTETHRTLGFLDGMASFFPDKEILSSLILLRESCFSKMIDYPHFDIRAMLMEQGRGNPGNDIQYIESAYCYAIDAKPQKLSYTSIINYALHGNDPKRKISTRTKPLFLTQSSVNYHQYNPTAPEKIQPALYDISKYIESNETDPLIKAAMCHYQFEMIHPYECYNGIVGRVLPYHILNNAGLNGIRLCAPSATLYRHKTEYFDKLTSTQKTGNYIAWIDFFIHIVKNAAQQGIVFIQYYNVLSQDEEKMILTRRQDKRDHTLDVYRHYKKNIASTIRHTSENLQLTFRTVSRSVAILQELGILAQITEGTRNRVFAHTGLWNRLISPN